MTTIPTIEDLMRALDENPELLAAMRARLLTRELLALPATVARNTELITQIAEQVAQNAKLIAQNAGKIDRNSERIAQLTSETNRRFEETHAVINDLKEETNRRFEETNAVINDLKTEMRDGFQSIRRDIGILKAAHARNVAEREASAITDALGLRRVRNLNYDDLRDLSLRGDTSGLSANVLMSFRRADLVMEAADSADATCYVAVEVSYTANGRDTQRAVRNAEFLTRFTGHPAHAAIAGVNRDNRIVELVESGALFWHQLEPEDLESD